MNTHRPVPGKAPTRQTRGRYAGALSLGTVAFIGIFAVLVAAGFLSSRSRPPATPSKQTPPAGPAAARPAGPRLLPSLLRAPQRLPTFGSCQALRDVTSRVGKAPSTFKRSLGDGAAPAAGEDQGITESAPVFEQPGAPAYSRTNVQVEGVDEADIVKTDGRFLYAWSAPERRLAILKATPPEELKTLGSIPYPTGTVSDFFLERNHLAIFGVRSGARDDPFSPRPAGAGVRHLRAQQGVVGRPTPARETFVDVWDVRDRAQPTLVRSIGFEGNYLASRMRDGTVYLALNNPIPSFTGEDDAVLLPRFRDAIAGKAPGDYGPIRDCDEISYFPPSGGDTFFMLGAFSLRNLTDPVTTEVVVGSAEKVYMSPESFYVAHKSVAPVIRPVPEPKPLYPPGVVYDQNKRTSPAVVPVSGPQTEVHKFALFRGEISYAGSAAVPGRVLNQFSMDEYNGVFRIATTQGFTPEEWQSALYTFDESLGRLGALEGLAPGEQITSARFMGKRAYLVTFRQVDPFFTIDLHDPSAPRVLGRLKIPGFSQYLHPYDETHILGVGKHASELGRVFGVKLALFDVTDVEHPTEVDLVEIGDQGTDSEVLSDHKAFLFDRQRNLLVLPISLVERVPGRGLTRTFEGAYVFRVSAADGFEYRSRLAHSTAADGLRNRAFAVRRSLYIGDFLYTVSDLKVFVHRLGDLVSVGSADL